MRHSRTELQDRTADWLARVKDRAEEYNWTVEEDASDYSPGGRFLHMRANQTLFTVAAFPGRVGTADRRAATIVRSLGGKIAHVNIRDVFIILEAYGARG